MATAKADALGIELSKALEALRKAEETIERQRVIIAAKTAPEPSQA